MMQITPSPRMLLTLDGGAVAAKYFALLYSDEPGSLIDVVGIAAELEDGTNASLVCENLNPTFRDYYGIRVSDDATYEDKKAAIRDATGWADFDEFPWVEIDETGEAIPGTDSDVSISRWLDQPIDDQELYIDWITRNVPDRYTPGFDIYRRLQPSEITELGLKCADLGGPASSVPCVSTSATIERLNAVLSRASLPYVFSDDAGSEEK